MSRRLAFLSSAALLAVTAHAQCPSGPTAGLVNWSSTAGYTSTLALNDEGITNPPIPLTAFPSFPMAGAVGTLDQMWVSTNGELYLTDSTLALAQPATGALYGVSDLNEMRGNAAGASARVVPLGGDHQGSAVAGAEWSITVDQSVPGEVKVSWVDMRRFANTSDRFSFSCRLFASGVVEYNYGNTFPLTGFTARYVGISIGNNVGTTTSPNQDLSAVPDSGAVGLLYQNFTGTAPNVWDLAGQTLTIVPNGLGGYTALPLVPYVPPTCASNVNYGAGCYVINQAKEAIYQLFPDTASSSAALPPGTSIQFTIAGPNSYLVTNGGGTYVPPSLTATVLSALTDDSQANVTPSIAFPHANGTSYALLSVCSNGFVNMAASLVNASGAGATVANMLSATAPSFRSNRDYNPYATGSGKVKYEEAVVGPDTILYVTWDGVYIYGTTTPETFQIQLNLTTGQVTMVWNVMVNSTSTQDLLVGCAPGTSQDPGSINLATALPALTFPDVAVAAMTLSASPRPVINPSTTVTYTVSNIPEYIAGSGLYIATMFLSLAPLPGVDLGFLGAPGCLAHIASLDLNLSVGPLPLTPTQTAAFTFDTTYFAPGNVVYAQAVALFDPALQPAYAATGNTFGLLTSTAVQHNIQAQ